MVSLSLEAYRYLNTYNLDKYLYTIHSAIEANELCNS
jgi:hypothetical protein